MKKYLLTYLVPGLIVILPILITFYIIGFFFTLLTEPFEEAISYVLCFFGIVQDGVSLRVIEFFSKVLILIALWAFIVFVGMCTPVSFARSFFFRFERLITKIPFVNTIYRLCKESINAFMNPQVSQFNLPALVPYPSPEARSVGLVMNEFKSDLLGDANEEFAAVIIPCTPNPTTGVLCIISKKEITYLNMSAQEGLGFILSFGNNTSK